MYSPTTRVLTILELLQSYDRISGMEGVIFRCRAQNLTWIAHFIVGWGWPLRVMQPPELRDELKKLAGRIAAYAEQIT